MENAVKTYFSDTKNLLYSFLISLPLFLAYELLILISQPDASQIVRISVDSWFKSILWGGWAGFFSTPSILMFVGGDRLVFPMHSDI